MQIVKYTGWTIDYIQSFDIKLLNKIAVWAFNQEKVERENLFAIMQWHLAIRHKKSRGEAKKNLKKALKKQPYNPEEDKTQEWINFFRSQNPQAFDKFYNSLHKKEN